MIISLSKKIKAKDVARGLRTGFGVNRKINISTFDYF